MMGMVRTHSFGPGPAIARVHKDSLYQISMESEFTYFTIKEQTIEISRFYLIATTLLEQIF